MTSTECKHKELELIQGFLSNLYEIERKMGPNFYSDAVVNDYRSREIMLQDELGIKLDEEFDGWFIQHNQHLFEKDFVKSHEWMFEQEEGATTS